MSLRGRNGRHEERVIMGESNTAVFGRFMSRLDAMDLKVFADETPAEKRRFAFFPGRPYAGRHFYGEQGGGKAQLAFLRWAAKSRSEEYVTVYSDMAPEAWRQNGEFIKAFKEAVTALLKRGVRLKVIHNVERPFGELMTELEAWIPIYMTGNAEAYYLPDLQEPVFRHLLYTCKKSALAGENVGQQEGGAVYYHTFRAKEAACYRNQAEHLLELAKPLVKVYRREQETAWLKQQTGLFAKKGDRRSVFTAPPLYTMSDELLKEILRVNGVNDILARKIRNLTDISRKEMERILKEDSVFDRIHYVPEGKAGEEKVYLALDGILVEEPLPYAQELYRRHIKELEQYRKKHQNYNYVLSEEQRFRNLQACVCEQSHLIVTRSNAPVVNLIFENPQMLKAFENYQRIQMETGREAGDKG